MKTVRSISVFAVAAMALVSCNKEIPGIGPVHSNEITFRVHDDALAAVIDTRAAEVKTSNLLSFNVMATSGTSGNETSAWTDGTFSGTSGGNFTGGKYWPSSSVSYHFYATNAAFDDFKFVNTGCTVSPKNANTDIVVAYSASPTYKEVNPLTFNHIFAQIGKCTVSGPSGYTISNLAVKISPKTSGTYNIRTSKWTSKGAAGSAESIANTLNSDADNDLWLVPDTYTLTATYTISKGNYSKSVNKTANVAIQQGKNNHISATLPAPDDISDITFTVTVTGWSDNTISGISF